MSIYKMTNLIISDDDVGKKLYRKKIFYMLTIEQDVVADNKDLAEDLLRDCGIKHENINHHLTIEDNDVATNFVDADYYNSDEIKCLGKIIKNEDLDDIDIDTLDTEEQ